MRRTLTLLALVMPLALAGCQSVLPGRDAPASAQQANPITGDEIAVTSLDGPTASAPAAPSPAPGAPSDTTPAQATRLAEGTPPLAPAADDAADGAPDAVAADPAPEVPEIAKSPAQRACEKRRGMWSVAGGGSAAFCQSPTRDAGKSCNASTDCTGYCLEKSRTCAPVTPMLGCHDILNEQGRMLTQCIN